MNGLLFRVLCCCLLAAGCQAEPPLDLAIRGGVVYDGISQDPQRVDVGVRGDRIAALGDLSAASARQVIDATGLAVAPGFIDVQGQSGVTLLVDGAAESHIRQGITTEIIGEGSSPAFWTPETAESDALQRYGLSYDWSGVDGYFTRLQRDGIAVNLGTLVPATMVRRQVIGLENRKPTPEELAQMEAMVDRAMRDGAFGLSSALIYPPGSFADTAELIALARAAARHGGIYATHIRGESFNLMNALDEAIRIGREAGLPVVIFHLKVAARAHWGRMPEVVRVLREARASGAHVGATMYPYTAGGTSLAASLPLWVQEGGRERMLERLKDPAVRERARREIETTIDGWENLLLGSGFEGVQIASVPASADPALQSIVGRRLSEIATMRGQDPWTTFFEILLETEGRAGALYHMMSEDDVRVALRDSGAVIGSDSAALRAEGLLAAGSPHPRAYGTFPRVLGKYVRDEKLLPLGQAIRRMTADAAALFRIEQRGQIRPGLFADIVVFDPETVRDTATFERPHQYPAGIQWVIVNGVPVLDPRGPTGARPGRPLYGPGRTAREPGS